MEGCKSRSTKLCVTNNFASMNMHHLLINLLNFLMKDCIKYEKNKIYTFRTSIVPLLTVCRKIKGATVYVPQRYTLTA